MTDKLAEICATKREEVAARKALLTLEDCDRLAAQASPRAGSAAHWRKRQRQDSR